MPHPIHFEIHAADPRRAIRFYTLFGWTFTKWESPMDCSEGNVFGMMQMDAAAK